MCSTRPAGIAPRCASRERRRGVILAVALFAWATIEYVQIEEDFRVARFEALQFGATPTTNAPQGERSYERMRGALDEMAREHPVLNELRLPR